MVALLGVFGCSELNNEKTTSDAQEVQKKDFEQILAHLKTQKYGDKIVRGVDKILAGDYEAANAEFNLILYDAPNNGTVHYLNGLAYHLRAEEGDVNQYDLAESGYKKSLELNASNDHAAFQLGRIMVAQKKYKEAQDYFAAALLINSKNSEVLYELANASYLAGDMRNANVAIDQYLKANPDKAIAQRAAALIAAAQGEGKKAETHLKKYQTLNKDSQQIQVVEARIEDWKKLHKTGRIMLAQAEDPIADMKKDIDTGSGPADAAAAAAPAAAAAIPGAASEAEEDKNMVVVDAIVMRVSESGATSKGNNILQNFSMTLAPGTHFYARAHGVGNTAANDFQGASIFPPVPATANPVPAGTVNMGNEALAVSRLFTQGISFGSVAYSLNIANATTTRVEIIGRPSLVAFMGKKASFFSGTELALGLSGQFGGGNITKLPVGSTLEVTVTDIKDDEVTLDVSLYGSALQNPTLPNDVTKAYTLIDMSKVLTSVKVKLGETIMLGGINERNDQYNKDGMPGVQDIPVIQYLFSKETTTNNRKSVMYLMTPRRYKDVANDIKKNAGSIHERYNMTELERRNKDWYEPRSNMLVTLRGLTPLYQEFRTGDLTPIRWGQTEYLKRDIQQVASFLYY
jgi:general secretion pathway protein D